MVSRCRGILIRLTPGGDGGTVNKEDLIFREIGKISHPKGIVYRSNREYTHIRLKTGRGIPFDMETFAKQYEPESLWEASRSWLKHRQGRLLEEQRFPSFATESADSFLS